MTKREKLIMNVAVEIDRLLTDGIEIHPNSPIHEKLNQALRQPVVSKSLNCGIITPQTRLAAACRRLQFEAVKSLGIFWLIEKIPWLKIKEPWGKLYKRTKR